MPFLIPRPEAKHIHILGICGTAMAPLAGLLRGRGWTVTGSDAGVYPPMSTFLESLGVPVFSGYDPVHLTPPPDLVVVGNAISRGNPELEAVLDARLPYLSLPETIRHLFLPGKIPLVVTGTHGKTTTSAMLAWCLYRLGADPSFLVGGLPQNFGAGYRLGAGEYFVLEGDEYDTAYFDKAPKFFHYRPALLVINAIEFDHADIYPDVETIEKQFRQLVNMLPAGGRLIYHAGCPRSSAVATRGHCPRISFGLAPGADWQARDLRTDPEGLSFTLLHREQAAGQIRLQVFGEYNALNALAVCAVLAELGFSRDGVIAALAEFQGVERRLTMRAEIGGIRIFDDFAHHPTAIRHTLRAVRQRFPGQRIWAVFEPRSWTCRKNIHQEAMAGCFDDADRILLAAVFRPEQIPAAERFRPELAAAALAARGLDARYLPDTGQIAVFLAENVNPGDVVVVMSNGGFDGIFDKLRKELKDA